MIIEHRATIIWQICTLANLLALSRYPMDTFAKIGIFRLNLRIGYINVDLEIFLEGL